MHGMDGMDGAVCQVGASSNKLDAGSKQVRPSGASRSGRQGQVTDVVYPSQLGMADLSYFTITPLDRGIIQPPPDAPAFEPVLSIGTSGSGSGSFGSLALALARFGLLSV